jgi:hypothetical protein
MFLGGTARPVFKADNLTAICQPIFWTVWDPQHLTALQASTACYGNIFTFFIFYLYEYSTLHAFEITDYFALFDLVIE